jgi:hypothetical protein
MKAFWRRVYPAGKARRKAKQRQAMRREKRGHFDEGFAKNHSPPWIVPKLQTARLE